MDQHQGMIARFFMDHKASDDWAARRRIIFVSLIWEAALITAIVVWAMIRILPNPLLDTALSWMTSLFGGTVGSYVFGAIWDSRSKRSASIAQSVVDNTADQTDSTTTVEVKP